MPARGFGFGTNEIINQKSLGQGIGRRKVNAGIDRAYNTPMQHPNLVVVQSYGSRPEADLAKGALEDAGIPAMVRGDTAGGMREHLAWSGAGFQILVREEDGAAAREVLAPPPGDAESLDANFQDDQDPPPSWRRFT
jgi:F420-dependent methylenetetrahydromethanopterin dehydrogenase